MNPAPVDVSAEYNLPPRSKFRGQGVTKNGEPIYFGMELRCPEWEHYRNSARMQTSYNATHTQTRLSRGIKYINMLTYLAEHIHGVEKDGKQQYIFEDAAGRDVGTVSTSYGFDTLDEFYQLIETLGRRGFTRGSDKSHVLKKCPLGIIDYNDYVVYVSKTPDFDIKKCPIKELTVKDFIQNYNNLLMIVGTDPEKYSIGIFRNPWSTIEGGYSGISMALHAFTGVVFKEHFEKQYLKINDPLAEMARIILKECNSDRNHSPQSAPSGRFAVMKQVERNFFVK